MVFTRKDRMFGGASREVEHPGQGHVAFETTPAGLTTVSAYVEEELRGQGLARRMFKELFDACFHEGFKTDYVYIDTDASSGFWDHVGFKPNPYNELRVSIFYGYEKRIKWSNLQKFALKGF